MDSRRSFTYRTDASYDWNYEHGPVWSGPLPAVPPTPEKLFLGLPVRSRLGISAGLLLNSRWVALYARLGFDILTYKTVRIKARASYPPPNWVFIDRREPLDPAASDETLVTRAAPASPDDEDVARITSSVSFGMPSKDPAVWTRDVAAARGALGPGQILVVSVVASPAPGDGAAGIAAEFGRLAALASEAGADAVEANLSCPNVCTAEGQIYQDPELSRDVARELRAAAGARPVLLKTGHFAERGELERFLRAVAGAASAVVLVNGMSRRIRRPDGAPAFGPGRDVAGILGRAIHDPCLANVRDAVAIARAERLDLEVAAVGGVLSEPDAARYFDAGAAAVLLGGGPMLEPELAVRLKAAHPEW